MVDKLETKVVQVSNIAPAATRDQIKTLFNYLGRIDEIKMYPTDSSDIQVTAKVCYVKYDDYTSVGVALHLTNTVFIDRALVVTPVVDGKIPDESLALQRAPSAVAGMLPGQPTWPSNVISQLQSVGGSQVITTNDPRLTALGLSQYPPLPSNTDMTKIEEIRRTIYVSNLDPSITGEMIMSFFAQVGEIKYVRMGGEEVEGGKCAYIEFTDQRTIATALTYNGVMFQSRPLSVAHSTTAIEKPKSKMQEAAQREIDEAMKKVKEAQSLITAAADSGDLNIEKTVSRLASNIGRSHSRSRSRSHRRRSRSRSRRRSRSRSHRRRSRSGRRSRSRRSSKSRKRSRSRSPSKKTSPKTTEPTKPALGPSGLSKPGPGMPGGPSGRKRSRSPTPRRRSRSRSRRRRSRSRSRRRRTRSRSRGIRSRSRRSRSKRRSRSRKRSSVAKTEPVVEDKKRSKRRSPSRASRSRKKSRSASTSPPKLRREGSASSSQAKNGDATVDKISSPAKKEKSSKLSSPPKKEKSSKQSSSAKKGNSSKLRSTSRSRSRSPSKRQKSRSRSRDRRKERKRSRRSRSTSRSKRSRSRKKSRSRSGSRHRVKKDKKKERDRSKEREKKKKHKEKDKDKEKEEKKDNKVKRDYDEEEATMLEEEDKKSDRDGSDDSGSEMPTLSARDDGDASDAADDDDDDDAVDSNLQPVDMDMSD